MNKICIIDTIGLCFDGSTLEKRGLGGSESAVILMARELVKIGFGVTVYNDCNHDDAEPGTYDGVEYRPLSYLTNPQEVYDVAISLRTVSPFVPDDLHWQLKNNQNFPDFAHVQKTKHKVLWMHDTFCDGDHLIEEAVNRGFIDEIFTLSDFHTSYVLNCDHGAKRNFEVLKNKTFKTRNGITLYNDFVDISKKDKNLFVYNASVTKGMIPLLEDIWPEIKQQIPDAKLTIIGGFYKFRDDSEPDEQEKKHVELYNTHSGKLDVNFTGIITQKNIAEILSKASYMLYPGAFPETFGISTLEALAYNTPPVTCQFGGVEEVAIDIASYKIRYAIEPNSLFPNIDKSWQVSEFVRMTVNAYNNPYLHQQKMYACNQVKDICTWDTVALQWKQHFYKVLNQYLPIEDYHKVKKINARVAKVFGGRFINPEDACEVKITPYNQINIITPVYNAEKYINACIKSVAQQDYTNYRMYIIDDNSTDLTKQVIYDTLNQLDSDLRSKFTVIENKENVGALQNQIDTIRNCGDDIIMLLDGDDSLVNDPTIFDYYNNLYNDGAEFTYGSCWSLADNIPLIAQPYPPGVKETKSYRDHKFNWNMPYTHLRTFRGSMFHSHDYNLGLSAFKDENGNCLRAGGDTSLFYAMIEMASPENVICVPHITVNYNDLNPLNDYKINGDEQTKNANAVIKNENKEVKKKILVGIPTAKYIEPETFKSIYNMTVPDGYETEFQYFYGYQIDQVRNLMSDWAKKYDYILFVDSDISFDTDSLVKLISADKDIVCGVYRQRLDNDCIEIYDFNNKRIKYSDIKTNYMIEIGACGMGCTLIKSDVIRKMEYPHFVYKSALSHENTFSEDVYFCNKARDAGAEIYCIPSIKCNHHGERVFSIDDIDVEPTTVVGSIQKRLQELHDQPLLPEDHVKYLNTLEENEGISARYKNKPVIYDIGSCVLHWTNRAKEVWPDGKFVLFEAVDEVEFLYSGYDYSLGVLTDEDNKSLTFNQSLEHPGGNSYYNENVVLSPMAAEIWTEENRVEKIGMSLDTIISKNNFPLPNIIKMDVQGAELDILKGAKKAIQHADYLILELQHVDYNVGAPKEKDVIKFVESVGFEILEKEFSKSVLGVDSDWCFYRPYNPIGDYFQEGSSR